MERFKVTFRDRRIEMFQADRLVESRGKVRLLDEEGEEVDSWDEEAVRAVQKVEPRGGGTGP